MGLAGEDFVIAVFRGKDIRVGADGFRFPQEERPAGPERVLEGGEYAALQQRLRVDQHVAATDQVELRKGRVLGQVMPREDAQAAHFLVDLVPCSLDEESPQARRGYAADGRLRVHPRAGLLHGGFTDVGAEHLNPGVVGVGAQRFEQHRQGVDLLAGGAARHPHANRPGAAVQIQLREHQLSQGLKHSGSRKKPVTWMRRSSASTLVFRDAASGSARTRRRTAFSGAPSCARRGG